MHNRPVRLARAFLDQLALDSRTAPAGSDALEALEGTLARLWERGRAAFPEVDLSDEVFAAHLAHHVPDAVQPMASGDALSDIHAEDLYLACACAHGLKAAVAVFERRLLAPVSEALARRRALPGSPDDFKQILGERLLVRGAQPRPRVATYSGRGPLAAWVRVAAVRAAINLKSESPERLGTSAEPPDALAVTTTAPDPELVLLRVQCRDEFREAFAAALAALDPRERTLLRFHFLQGLEGEVLARMYGVSRRTVHRWLEQGRQALLDRTREHLAARLEMPPEELASLMHALQSELGSTLARHLEDPRH